MLRITRIVGQEVVIPAYALALRVEAVHPDGTVTLSVRPLDAPPAAATTVRGKGFEVPGTGVSATVVNTRLPHGDHPRVNLGFESDDRRTEVYRSELWAEMVREGSPRVRDLRRADGARRGGPAIEVNHNA